jgi:hypothetical protein
MTYLCVSTRKRGNGGVEPEVRCMGKRAQQMKKRIKGLRISYDTRSRDG